MRVFVYLLISLACLGAFVRGRTGVKSLPQFVKRSESWSPLQGNDGKGDGVATDAAATNGSLLVQYDAQSSACYAAMQAQYPNVKLPEQLDSMLVRNNVVLPDVVAALTDLIPVESTLGQLTNQGSASASSHSSRSTEDQVPPPTLEVRRSRVSLRHEDVDFVTILPHMSITVPSGPPSSSNSRRLLEKEEREAVAPTVEFHWLRNIALESVQVAGEIPADRILVVFKQNPCVKRASLSPPAAPLSSAPPVPAPSSHVLSPVGTAIEPQRQPQFVASSVDGAVAGGAPAAGGTPADMVNPKSGNREDNQEDETPQIEDVPSDPIPTHHPAAATAAPVIDSFYLEEANDHNIPNMWWYGRETEDNKYNGHLSAAHAEWTGVGRDFVVAVLDTGCDLEHPDLFAFRSFDQYYFNAAEAGLTAEEYDEAVRGDSQLWDAYVNGRCSDGVDDDNNGIVDDCFGVVSKRVCVCGRIYTYSCVRVRRSDDDDEEEEKEEAWLHACMQP
eukprot:GHVU01060746.1.p1 GENE.GHVU01060746.1~~GHVU01060746.1.p1  ORF type:complete len:502 (+),score=93.21 GHVU01060746.1:67-1572(+)